MAERTNTGLTSSFYLVPPACAGVQGRSLRCLLIIAAQIVSLHMFADRPSNSMVVAIPAFHKDARILFQGDSITDASRGESSDSKHALGNGYVSIIAGRYRSAFPELNLTFLNCGVCGNTVLDLARRWRQDTLDLSPDVLSVLIGVNDAGKGVPLDRYEQVYDKLLADVRAANPAVRFVL